MKEDSFEDILRKKLQNYQSAEEVPSWQQMQRRMELYKNAHPELRLRNPIRKRILYGAAAVLLFAAVGLGGYKLSQSPIFDSKRSEATLLPSSNGTDATRNVLQTAIKDHSDNSALTDVLRSAKKVEVIAPQSVQQTVTLWAENEKKESADAYSSPSQVANSQETPSDDSPTVVSASSDEDRGIPVSDREKSETAAVSAEARSYDPEIYNRFFNKQKSTSKGRSSRRWTVGAFADASTFSSVSPNSGAIPRLSSFAMSAQIQDMTVTKSDYPIDFTAGSMDHRLPVSVGLNVRKYITPRLGVETGLVYSYLQSQAQLEGAFGYKYTQKVHYLGIPLSVTYSVLDRKRLDIYFIGGLMVEKALYTTGQVEVFNGSSRISSTTNRLSANGVLGSVHAGTGFGYNFIDRMGLYIEPSVNYYFRNDNQPITYRTANRWNINIRMGLRYNF